MGNYSTQGFELVGKVFGRRTTDVLMYVVFDIGSTIVTLLPIIGIVGLALLDGSLFNLETLDHLKLDQFKAYSIISTVFGVYVITLVLALIFGSFITCLGISLIKHAREGSSEGFSSTIRHANANWGRMVGLNSLILLMSIGIGIVLLLALPVLSLLFTGFGSYSGGALMLILVLVGLLVLTYNLLPLATLAPMDIVSSKTTVIEAFSNALGKSGQFKSSVFWIFVLMFLLQTGVQILFMLIRLQIVAMILLIPVNLVLWCFIKPVYIDYKNKLVAVSANSNPEPEPATDDKPNDDMVDPQL